VLPVRLLKMATMLYSSDFEKYTEKLPNAIQESIREIEELFEASEIAVLKINDFSVAIPFAIEVNLPSKGTHENIDIRQFEPILISFSINNYPTTSPRVKSDRKDFPSSNLSHLYAVTNGEPPTLCLVRENLDEWFANRRISDLISVAKQWFSKAANGLLSEDADEFEPVRLEGYIGYSIYSHLKLYRNISENKRHSEKYPYSYLLKTTNLKGLDNPSFRILDVEVTSKNLQELLLLIMKLDIKFIKERGDNDVNLHLFGLLVWNDNFDSNNLYSTSLPKTYSELVTFAAQYSISIKEPIGEYIKDGLVTSNLTSYIPIIVGVRRPKKLIGFESNIEFFHFVIKVDKESIEENTIIPEAKVFFQSHREPISSNLAQKISLNNNQKKTVFIGAGALGSKLLFHYARGGNFNLKAIDNNTFSPHNIVRHDLFMESSGVNKAKAVIEKIKSFLDNGSSLKYHDGSIFNYDNKQLDGYSWLIDTSASLNVQNWLVNSKLNNVPNRARAEIAYKGILGLLYIEGENQNPRIDDLVNYVYFLATNIDVISEWLVEENKKKEGNDYDIVDIGIGCNSPTVIMANDSMSFHSSIFSKILNHESKREKIKKKGFLNISFISEDGLEINSISCLVPPFDIFKCSNNSGWEIRLVPTVLAKMKLEAKKYKRHETGGIFIGICNYKTKTIQVYDTITAPPDSKHSPVYFYRGIENLPEQVEYIKEISGGMIGYIGEWHTHPMGLDSLSGVDEAAVEELKPLNDKYPIPTFISILSKEKYLPFVF
jgi:hypothetical protein